MIKENGRRISDATAGTKDYFELATTNLSLYRDLRAAAEEFARGRLLDAGAGRGAYREMLTPLCDRYESLDVTDAYHPDYVADLQDTKLPGEQYDTIFCTQVIHHLPDPARAIAEMARMLKPGGRLILSVPHLAWLHNEPHDYWRFTPHSLRVLLDRAGLAPVRIEKLGGLVCFLAYAPSTVILALLWPMRPLFRLGLLINKFFIRAALLLDQLIGMKSLYPTNLLVVAEKV